MFPNLFPCVYLNSIFFFFFFFRNVDEKHSMFHLTFVEIAYLIINGYFLDLGKLFTNLLLRNCLVENRTFAYAKTKA